MKENAQVLVISQLLKQRDVLLECIKAACKCIAIDSKLLAECHTDPKSGELDEAGKAGVAGYAAVLDKIDSAIAIATSPPPGEFEWRGTVPFFSHETVTGEGNGPVKCLFDMNEEDGVCDLQVWAGPVDIFRWLTAEQVEQLETECTAAAELQFEQSKTDAAISKFESNRDDHHDHS